MNFAIDITNLIFLNQFLGPVFERLLSPVFVGFFALLVWIIALISIKSYRAGKARDAQYEEFAEFVEANSVRKKEIDPALFYTPTLEGLPEIPENDPHQVLKAASRKMIKIDASVTTLDLKKQYGLVQLGKIADYEENYVSFHQTLIKWASELNESGELNDALAVVEYMISLGTEFREAYKLAGEIYLSLGKQEKIAELLESAQTTHFDNPVIKQSVTDYVQGLLA